MTRAVALLIAVVALGCGGDAGQEAIDSRVPEVDLDIDAGTPETPASTTTVVAPTVTVAGGGGLPASPADEPTVTPDAPTETTASTTTTAPATTTAPPVDWSARGACMFGPDASNPRRGDRLAEWQTAGGTGYPADYPGEWATRAETLNEAWPGRLESWGC